MTFMWKEINEQPQVLERCFDYNYNTSLEIAKAVKEKQVRYAVIAARGTSDHAGIYGKYLLEAYAGLPVGLAAPSVTTMYGSSLDFSAGLVIGISQSGEAKDVLAVLKSAKKSGAITVGITNFVDSPVAKEVDFHLWCHAGLEKSVAATKTFTSQMMALAILSAAISGKANLFEQLKKVPELVLKVLDAHEGIDVFVKKYTFAQELFVLARGLNYPIALEQGLKIQETTYIRAKSYAVSDFHHGPFAMLSPLVPVLVFALKDAVLDDVNIMLDKLKEKNLEIIVVGNDAKTLEKGTESFMLPDCEPAVSPFLSGVFAQMFACKLAIAKGLNPDKPRDLNKVTITE